MIVTTDVTGAPVAINPDRVEGLTVAAGVSPASVLVRTQREAFVLPGTVADVAALLPSSGGAPSGPAGGDLEGTYPDPSLAAGVWLAIGAAIDGGVAAVVDADGYGPVFDNALSGGFSVTTAPDGLRYTRIGDMVTITGVLRVDTTGAPGAAGGPIATMTLPATSTKAAGGGGFLMLGTDTSDVWPTLGLAVAPLGVVATVIVPASIQPAFVVDYGISLTIRI